MAMYGRPSECAEMLVLHREPTNHIAVTIPTQYLNFGFYTILNFDLNLCIRQILTLIV